MASDGCRERDDRECGNSRAEALGATRGDLATALAVKHHYPICVNDEARDIVRSGIRNRQVAGLNDVQAVAATFDP